MNLEQLADSLQLSFSGSPDTEICRLDDIHTASEGSLAFVVNARYREALQKCKASAVIANEELSQFAPCPCLVSPDPYLTYAQASRLLHPDKLASDKISSSAEVASTAVIGAGSEIGANVTIAAGANIGASCVIGAGCYIGENVQLGEHCRLFPNVTILDGSTLGRECRVQSGVVIGSEGFGYAWSGEPQKTWERINQIGCVVIGEKVEIGANTTIDRGALGDTRIADGVILDNQIQVAHNVSIGTGTAIAGCVGIAGSTRIGNYCRIGGQTGIVGHIEIADHVTITATYFVSRSIDQSGVYSSGMPLQKNSDWHKTFARLSKLDQLFIKVRRLNRDKGKTPEAD